MKKFFGEFELYVGAFFQGAMIVILFAQVISRYVFNNAFSWAEELAVICFILSVYLGATAAIRKNQHLRLTIILDKLSKKNRLILDIINNLFFALFNIIIMTGIVPIVFRLMNNGTTTAVTGIPKWIIYAVLPILFALMILRLVQDSMAKIKEFKNLKGPLIEQNTGN